MRLPDALKLAAAFCDQLECDLTPEQLDLANERNAREVNLNVCHTHDFIDANESMAQAWESLTGRAVNLQDANEVALFGDAWGIAKDCEFSADACRSYFNR